jgi:hypothetical protein
VLSRERLTMPPNRKICRPSPYPPGSCTLFSLFHCLVHPGPEPCFRSFIGSRLGSSFDGGAREHLHHIPWVSVLASTGC